MQKQTRRYLLAILLVLLALLLGGCKQNPPESRLYAKLNRHFASYGFNCVYEAVQPERSVPIYKAESWRSLMLDEEAVLVYFDESNRADYLADGIAKEDYSFVGRFGLRFVLVYEGTNEKVLQALEAMPQ